MPAMPRIKGKGKKIAFKVLGTPPNLQEPKRNKTQSVINKRLIFEETQRVR